MDLWKYARWLPAVIALLLIAIGGVELFVVIALVVIQILLILLPIAARGLGRVVGKRQGG